MSEQELTLDGMTSAEATMEPPKAKGFDFQRIMASPAFWPGVALALGIGLCFWSLLKLLPDLWMSKDGYYSHGFLVPLISGYIVFKRWDKLKNIPVKPGWMAAIFLVPLMYLALVATSTPIDAVMSLAFVATIMVGVWLVAGLRWMLALSLPILYLAFALPVWTMAIEIYTNPLQRVSTDVAIQLLNLFGFETYRDNATNIYLNNFTLDVGIPCSGLRLILALTAFTFFFVLIANLKWWANLLMIGMILPLALLINGLRISLIGVVGEMKGEDAAHTFHDYSGYITLLICFFILFKIARWLGWKD